VSEPTRVALVGREILDSRSPWLHEQEARAQGLALEYHLVDFTARGLADGELPRVLADLTAGAYAGTNVTYPFKQAVIALLTRVAPEAARIGAVNTVAFRAGERCGYNTDATGFAAGMRSGLRGVKLGTAVQIGAGGAGSATAFALLDLGLERLLLFDTDAQKCAALRQRLASEFGERRVEMGSDIASAMRAADGIVNATPVGMAKHPGTPIPPALIASRHWVADIVYFPLETELLRVAEARGCRVLNGAAMAVGQAAAAFEIFTGRPADLERMLASFRQFPGAH
jgi:shikimate dehydrogenase